MKAAPPAVAAGASPVKTKRLAGESSSPARPWRACWTCAALVVISFITLIAPWWWPWLLWRRSTTNYVQISEGMDPLTYAVTNASLLPQPVIPRIIHQTWKDHAIPEKWRAARQACRNLHPEYEFRLWTDAEARELVASQLPAFLPTYDSYRYNIQRADAIRYVILYLHGGFYLDLDIQCRAPLDFLRGYPFVMPATRPVGFSNDFLGAAPGHAFMATLLDALPAWNVWLVAKYPSVMFSTGPMFVTLQASLYPARRALWVLPAQMYGKYVRRHNPLFRHLFGSSWHGRDAAGVIWVARHPACVGALTMAALGAALGTAWRCSRWLHEREASRAAQADAVKMC